MGILDRFKKSSKTAAPAAAKTAVQPVAKATVTAKKNAVKKPVQIALPPTGYTAILVRPLVTEKSTSGGTYNFRVAKSASKNEIAKAFKARYGKMPRKVNVINVLGKTKFRGRTAGKRINWKKAVIYLTKGETVDISK